MCALHLVCFAHSLVNSQNTFSADGLARSPACLHGGRWRKAIALPMALLSEVHASVLRKREVTVPLEVSAGVPALSLYALDHQGVAAHVAFESVIHAVCTGQGQDAGPLLGPAIGPTCWGLSCHSC